MRIVWQIDASDAEKIKRFYDAQKEKAFVRNRIDRNINKMIPGFSQDRFWEAAVSCLLTTQQRSGPDSAVTRFICTKPFPLNYAECKKAETLKVFAEDVITRFGGIRRAITLGQQIDQNFRWLESGGWDVAKRTVEDLEKNQTRDVEAKAADVIMDNLKGFGPKQARNLLQALGLTKYEIPVDSRITKWLNEFGFPVKLSAAALADPNYYNFVLDGFQKLCESCDIIPCAIDAAIFASSDPDWPEDRLIW
jgi:hypothetical protein